MTYTGLRFGGRNATLVRPADKDALLAGDAWARDRSSALADDGTELDATWANRVKANLEGLVAALGGSLNDGDAQLANAVLAKFSLYTTTVALTALLAGKSDTGHVHAVSALTDGSGYVRMTDAERAKLASLVANYKGAFAALTDVAVAYPSASAGDWAIISRPGAAAALALWDADASPAAWVDSGVTAPATAATTPFTPSGSIAATNVQSALQELDAEKQAASANLTSWSGIAPAAKQDTLGYTPWHAGNDGAASGLDADLLDGQHGSHYYSASNPPPASGVADVRLGTVTNVSTPDGSATNLAAGYVATGFFVSAGALQNVNAKPIQKYISGAWTTVSG